MCFRTAESRPVLVNEAPALSIFRLIHWLSDRLHIFFHANDIKESSVNNSSSTFPSHSVSVSAAATHSGSATIFRLCASVMHTTPSSRQREAVSDSFGFVVLSVCGRGWTLLSLHHAVLTMLRRASPFDSRYPMLMIQAATDNCKCIA
jgi:hypothetical protein